MNATDGFGPVPDLSMTNKFFVVPAPGWYGEDAVVISSHRTIEAALRAANRPNRVVRVGGKKKGDRWEDCWKRFIQ